MRHRHLAALVTVVVVGALASVAVAGQSQSQEAGDGEAAWTLPRTPDGQPDLQGYWTTQTFTPLERPERLADREFLSEEETAALQQQLTAEGVDPLRRDAIAIEDPEAREEALYQDNRDASYVHYDNQVWLRTPVPKGLSTRRTSLITYPPNGRIPPMTPEGAARVEAEAAMARVFDGYETRPLMERCVVWTHEGPPLLPPAYNDIHQIFQTPDHFVLFTELATNPPWRSMGARAFPTPFASSAATRAPARRERSSTRWSSRARETGNFIARRNYRGSNQYRHIEERFTLVDANTIRYEFTITDPSTWTSPWSGEVPMVRTEGPMYEYGCHEGNHDIRHILEINRNLERQAAEAAAGARPR